MKSKYFYHFIRRSDSAFLRVALLALLTLLATSMPSTVTAQWLDDTPQLVASGLTGTAGSTVGPDGAVYVTESGTGSILRVDAWTGIVSTFAEGLPSWVVPGIGGPMDLAFVDGTAYVLVTLVGPDVGGSDVVGIYRMEDESTFTPNRRHRHLRHGQPAGNGLLRSDRGPIRARWSGCNAMGPSKLSSTASIGRRRWSSWATSPTSSRWAARYGRCRT